MNWILLRGLTRESGHWGAFPALLAKRFPQDRIVTPDFPGNGAFYESPSLARIEAMTAWCRDHLRAAGHAPPYRLLALSMGAMVAVDWAARWPEELAGCVLVNTSLRPFDAWHRRLRPSSYLKLLEMALLPMPGGDHERAILRLTSNDREAAAAVLDAWTRLRLQHPVSTSNALRQLLAASRYLAPTERPDVPLLILASRLDRLVDVRCSETLAARWKADLAVHPTAGHDLPLDAGEWVVAQVKRWLADAAPGL